MVEKLSTEKHLAQFVRCSKKIAEQALPYYGQKKCRTDVDLRLLSCEDFNRVRADFLRLDLFEGCPLRLLANRYRAADTDERDAHAVHLAGELFLEYDRR